MNIGKILLTFPYFLHSFKKARSGCRKIYKDPNAVLEENRYFGIKRKIKYILGLCDIKIAVKGGKHGKNGPVLALGNHQSRGDPLLIFALNDFEHQAPCAFIAKQELIKTKLRYFAALINIFYLDRKNPRSAFQIFKKASEAIRFPRTLVVFPEGTRAKNPPTLLEFQPAVVKIAKKSYAPILPFTVINSYKINRWSQRRSYVLIILSPPIKPQTFVTKPEPQLMSQIQKQIQKNLDEYQDISRREIKTIYQDFKSEKRAQKKEQL